MNINDYICLTNGHKLHFELPSNPSDEIKARHIAWMKEYCDMIVKDTQPKVRLACDPEVKRLDGYLHPRLVVQLHVNEKDPDQVQRELDEFCKEWHVFAGNQLMDILLKELKMRREAKKASIDVTQSPDALLKNFTILCGAGIGKDGVKLVEGTAR